MFNKKAKNQAGIITLEILIALTIIIVVISAVILVVFGNQTLASDTQTNNEALYLAQQKIDEARIQAGTNFNSVTNSSYNFTSGPLTYNGKSTVTDISQCLKQIAARIDWTLESRPQYSSLTTLLSSPSEALALGGDCASSPPSGAMDWHHPAILTQLNRQHLGSVDMNDVDLDDDFLFIASGSTSINKEDIVIEDTSNINSVPPPGNFIDGDAKDEGVYHFDRIDVARNLGSSSRYAYIFQGNDVNTNQFQIIDVTNPYSISGTPVTATLPGVTNPEQSGGAIYFYKDKIYIGTGYLVTGDELHIYNVSVPITPIHIGNFNVNHNIYKIIVRDQLVGGVVKTLAYMAVSGTDSTMPELLIYDVTNPASISLIGSLNVPGTQYGMALYILGNKAYLGNKAGTNPNFYIIDISNPSNPTTCGSCHFTLSGENVKDLIVSGNFAFIITNNNLHALDISDPSNIKAPVGMPSGGILSGTFTSIDLDIKKNLVYLTAPNQGNIAFYIVYSAP